MKFQFSYFTYFSKIENIYAVLNYADLCNAVTHYNYNKLWDIDAEAAVIIKWYSHPFLELMAAKPK